MTSSRNGFPWKDLDEKSCLTVGVPFPRLAAVDIGTTSFRCIVVEVDPQEGFRVLDDEKTPVRLNEGFNQTGKITPVAHNRAIEALQRMNKIITGLGANLVKVVATSAVRKAGNREAFIHEIKAATDLDIEVISGNAEADLALYHRKAAPKKV